jgi:hypothetical protein
MQQILSKGIGFAIALLFSIQVLGHNPQVSTLAFNKASSSSWSLMVRAPLLSFQLALQHQFPKTDVNALTPDEFKQLITTHVRNSIVINEGNGHQLTMDSISIALGHEVLIMGKLNAAVSFSSILSISNQVFASLHDHFSILSIEEDGKEMLKTVLNKENEFTAQVNEVIPKEAVKPAEKGNGQIVLYAFFVIIFVSLFYILLSGPTPKKN